MNAAAPRRLDADSAEFWNELCGSWLARSLGITDHTTESLRRFDEAYIGLYPYLLRRVPVSSFAGLRVLEVGLGYGTLGQKIAQSCASYPGLDIAPGPVEMMRYRFSLQGIAGEAVRGNMLNAPFPDACFDRVVSIGCFHHTGDAQRALDETWRILRPGGRAYIMVYNKFSLRQWMHWPLITLGELAGESGLRNPASSHVTGDQKRAYDTNSASQEAPETRFFSISELRRICARFRSVRFQKENCDPLTVGGRQFASRERLLRTIGAVAGLDIYMTAVK